MINLTAEEIDDSALLDLIEEIREAFADVPYPADDNIFGTPEHRAVCEECRDLNKLFAGKSWPIWPAKIRSILKSPEWHCSTRPAGDIICRPT